MRTQSALSVIGTPLSGTIKYRDTSPWFSGSLTTYVDATISEIKEQYLRDERPWIIGLSGGKDSTCITQLIYEMLLQLEPSSRKKHIFILSSDTLVESPPADVRRRHIARLIEKQVKIDNMPMTFQLLRPDLSDTFWVNLLGRGYPSPNKWFRWCTERLKIKPMNNFVKYKIKENGEVVIVLGVRKSESINRQKTIEKYEIEDSKLSIHANIQGAFVYAPISGWSESQVKEYLLTRPSPWGDDNKAFLDEYYSRGEEDPEFMMDNDGKTWGTSRMGCWVCTVVPKDHSIEWFIADGKTWLAPLRDYRQELLQLRDNSKARFEIRKTDRKKQIYSEILGKEFKPMERYGFKIPGPFTFETRHYLFKRLLKLQNEPSELKDKIDAMGARLISPEEIQAIVNLWIYEGDSLEDIRSTLMDCGVGETFVDYLIKREDIAHSEELKKISTRNGIDAELIEKLLIIEKDLSGMSRRHGVYNRLEAIVEEYALSEMLKEARKNEDN